jgi:glutamate-1-semialdehyde 2,1-aminomutase
MSAAQKRNATLDDAVAAAEARFIAANPKSRARFVAARRSMRGGNPRTTLHYDPVPLAIGSGQGARITDIDGHAYTDFLGEYTAGLYGHSHPVLIGALKAALDGGLSFGAPGETEARFADLMVGRFPSLERIRFCNSGTEANLMAVSLARVVTGRAKVMVFHGGYHGALLYFVSQPAAVNAPFPYVIGRYNDPQHAADLIAREGSDLAAVLMEPMQGSGGCIPATPEFLQAVRDAVTKAGSILIFDEVMTSRLHPGGLQGALGIHADLTTFGKYLGGGASFGAFGGRADLMDRFDPTRADALPHAGTFNNNVLSMSAGFAGLSQVFTPEACAKLNGDGDMFRDRLNAIAKKLGAPARVTGRGSMLCVHFQHGAIARVADITAPPATRKLFHLEMLEAGQSFARRGFMALSLPLDTADYDAYADAFENFLQANTSLIAAA